MPKKYNLSSKSDMRRLTKDLNKFVIETALEAAENGIEFDVECPLCHHQIKAKAGLNTCPVCHEEFELTLQVHQL